MSGRLAGLGNIPFGPFLEHAIIAVPATYRAVTIGIYIPGLRSMGEVGPTEDALTAWQNICLCS